MNKSERNPLIIRLWLERPQAERTRTEVLIFYGWLQQNRPDLIPVTRRGDPYQALQSILTPYVTGER